MRIAFVVSELRYSGGVRVTVEYANRLAQRGHKVSIVTSAVGEKQDALLLSDAVCLLSAPEALDRRGSLHNWRLAVEMARRVPRGDVVIATHTPTAPVALFAARLLRRGRAVWLCMDYAEMFAGRPLQALVYNNASPWFDLVLCLSRSSAEELPRPRWPGRAPCIAVVGVGLSDLELLWPSDPARRSRREILYLGDSRPRKGLADVLAALLLVREQVPDVSLAVVSKEELRSSLDANARVLFRFCHKPDRRALAGLYASCGVFVSGSWAEGFGLPPLEAMACGAPVVVTDSRGVREFARHEVNCLVVPPRNPAAMAAAIARLLLDRSLADRLGAAAVETAAAFDWERAVDRFEDALLKLTASGAALAQA